MKLKILLAYMAIPIALGLRGTEDASIGYHLQIP